MKIKHWLQINTMLLKNTFYKNCNQVRNKLINISYYIHLYTMFRSIVLISRRIT